VVGTIPRSAAVDFGERSRGLTMTSFAKTCTYHLQTVQTAMSIYSVYFRPILRSRQDSTRMCLHRCSKLLINDLGAWNQEWSRPIVWHIVRIKVVSILSGKQFGPGPYSVAIANNYQV
jgi:hypothetical protein